MLKTVLLLTILYLVAAAAHSQSPDTTSTRLTKLSFLPVVYYSPETRLAFGGDGIFTFRNRKYPLQLYPSQAQLGIAYTLNKQWLFYLPFRIYLHNDRFTAYGELGYYRYSYYFYGIGNQQTLDQKELYKVNYPRVRVNFLAKIVPQLYGGIRYWLEDYNVYETTPGGLLMTDSGIPGRKGSTTSGVGPVLNFDSRDNIFSAGRGWFVDAAVQFYTNVSGSQYDYTRYTLDATKYLKLGKNVLAINLFGDFISGVAPFSQLALLGGNKKMRGYYEGRYRDKNLVATGAEYRFRVYKRFGAVAFVNAGSVNETLRNIGTFIRTSYGGGVRYAVNKQERINIRLDAGFGQHSSGYYFTIGEAF